MAALWFLLGVAVLGLSWYALTETAYPGLWWGGLVVSLLLMLVAALWLLAAVTNWVSWRLPQRQPVRVTD